jgi:chemosensory pili system protein ChpA (sensor histidine kinase/response regulator)
MAEILLVDDTPAAIEPVARYLAKSGHAVKCVANGREALAQVMDHLPDVIVLDLMMPEMDGSSFLEVVRSYLRLKSLPVVVLTGLADDPLIDRARALRPNSVLAKDKASLDEIRQAVERAATAATA